jgi:hypothetical protein
MLENEVHLRQSIQQEAGQNCIMKSFKITTFSIYCYDEMKEGEMDGVRKTGLECGEH